MHPQPAVSSSVSMSAILSSIIILISVGRCLFGSCRTIHGISQNVMVQPIFSRFEKCHKNSCCNYRKDSFVFSFNDYIIFGYKKSWNQKKIQYNPCNHGTFTEFLISAKCNKHRVIHIGKSHNMFTCSYDFI